MSTTLDLVITNVPSSAHGPPRAAAVGHRRHATATSPRSRPDIDPPTAAEVVDGGGQLAFPGVVDAHQHWGIYNPLAEDAGPRAAPAPRAA